MRGLGTLGESSAGLAQFESRPSEGQYTICSTLRLIFFGCDLCLCRGVVELCVVGGGGRRGGQVTVEGLKRGFRTVEGM